MTVAEKRPGRPPKGAPPRTLTPFGAAVVAALDARRDALAPGPRSLAELARVCECSGPLLVQVLGGARTLTPRVEQAVRAALPELA